MNDKIIITYSDLSGSLKIAIILAWIVGITWVGAFLWGFMQGLMSY